MKERIAHHHLVLKAWKPPSEDKDGCLMSFALIHTPAQELALPTAGSLSKQEKQTHVFSFHLKKPTGLICCKLSQRRSKASGRSGVGKAAAGTRGAILPWLLALHRLT